MLSQFNLTWRNFQFLIENYFSFIMEFWIYAGIMISWTNKLLPSDVL